MVWRHLAAYLSWLKLVIFTLWAFDVWEITSFLPVSIEDFEMHFMAKHFQNVYTEFDNEPLCVDNENLKFHHQLIMSQHIFIWN